MKNEGINRARSAQQSDRSARALRSVGVEMLMLILILPFASRSSCTCAPPYRDLGDLSCLGDRVRQCWNCETPRPRTGRKRGFDRSDGGVSALGLLSATSLRVHDETSPSTREGQDAPMVRKSKWDESPARQLSSRCLGPCVRRPELSATRLSASYPFDCVLEDFHPLGTGPSSPLSLMARDEGGQKKRNKKKPNSTSWVLLFD